MNNMETAQNDQGHSLLSITGVTVRFGGITALDRVTFDIRKGQIFGLIGPNGAGKTTLFNCISRLYQTNEGDIRFEGQSILKHPVYRMCATGIGRTFQNLALFPSMSVLDNVMVGGHHHTRADYFSNALRLRWIRNENSKLQKEAMHLIDYLDLTEVAYQPVGALPFGTQKRVELARALAGRPKLLLLDEPAGGLNHDEVDKLRELILKIRTDFDLSILLVEHHMSLVMAVSDQVAVLNFGVKIGDDTPENIQQNKDVIQAYLGTEKI